MDTMSFGLGTILKQQLDVRKQKNKKYSLRAFARDIQVSPSTVSKIMNGKYVLSDKMLETIVDYLSLETPVRQRIIFFERCRKLSEFLISKTEQSKSESTVRADSFGYQRTIRLDKDMLYDVMFLLKEINDGFLQAVETMANTKDTELHLSHTFMMTMSPIKAETAL